MTVYPIQANFSRGELSPRLHARIDIDYYKAGLKTCTNWTALRQGGLRKRSGFKMVKEVKDSTKKARMIPFVFSTVQAYALEFGNLYMRIYVNGGLVTTGGGTITGITKANPAVVTVTAHGFSNGDKIYITGVGGMTQVNNLEFTVAGITANTFQLSGINSTGYTTFTSGGLAKKIVEVTTPYLEADLPTLDYAQSADVLTITHQNYQPREISRTSDTTWTIATCTFKDGPYLEEPINISNGAKPSARNVVCTGGTASDANVFDGDEKTVSVVTAGSWTVSYTLAAAPANAVCNNYYVQQGGVVSTERAITAWAFEGFDGTSWGVLHRVADQGSWGTGEKRFYDFVNNTPYTAYRMVITANAGGTASGSPTYQFAETGWGYNGDYAPTMTLTFDNTSGINGGAGFDSNDVGRPIRLYSSDGKWRWFSITGVTSTTVVTGRMYGYALPDTDKIYRWKLGAWRSGQWPAKVSFYEGRRVFARSTAEAHVINFTKTADFYDFGTSQPLVDDDGIRVRLLSGRVNAITWLVEAERLAIGTVGNIRVLGKANDNLGFGATNFDQKQQTSTAAKEVKPVSVGSVILFADYYGKVIREFVYDLNQDGYIAPDVSILSDHLLRTGIVEMAYQGVPDSTVWIVTADGGLVAMTYEREQKIVSLSRITLGVGDSGTLAYVESVCSIPGSGRDEVWIIVRRTIGGVTKRYIETLAPEFEYTATEDGVFLDSSLSYSGSATGTVSGINHLIGRTVWALADGQVVRNLTVSASGSITLPNSQTASKICVGLPYTATLTTLALNDAGQQDGTGLSRRKLLNDVRVSVMDALGLKAQGIGAIDYFDIFQRDQNDPVNAQMTQRTGTYAVNFDMSWRDDGQFTLFSDDPLPCTLRGIILSATGEP
jgi:hypothetical protein